MQAVQPAGACWVGEADWANLDFTMVAGGPPPSGIVMPAGTDGAVSELHVGEGCEHVWLRREGGILSHVYASPDKLDKASSG